jgi:hypothetical protein
MSANLFFLLNLLSTWYMVGLIWMVQIVHYNLMDRVGREQFVRYETDHARLITPIVLIPMLIEISSAFGLLLLMPPNFPGWAAWAGFVMVIAIWISTAFIQVPYHRTLMTGFTTAAYRGLVGSNWIRTVLWTMRGLMMGWFAWIKLSS